MKKFTLLRFKTLLVLTFLVSSLNAFSQTVDLIADVGSTTPPLTIGETFTYTLQAIAGTTDYQAAQIYLNYNQTVIQLNSLTPDNSVLGFTLINDTATPGVIRYAAGSIASVSGTTNVFTAVFEVIGTSEDVMIIHDLEANGNPNGTTVSDGGGNDILGIANDIILSTLSVENTEFGSSISIFPNPVTDVLNIKLNASSSEIGTIKVFSIEGKLIQQYNTVSLTDNLIKLDTSMLNQALYFVMISSTENELAIFKMVVN